MQPPTPSRPSPGPARHFAGQSIKTGAYQFIPVPFVDDWLTARERLGMVQAVLNDRGLTYDPDVPRLLAGGSRSFAARLTSMGKGLVMKPLRKVFRTMFFWMTAHQAARTVVETYFLGRFLHHPALLGEDGGSHLTARDGRRLARVFEEVSKNLDLRAARNVVGRVGRLLIRRRAKQVTPREMRAAIEEEDPGFVAGFDRLVTQRLSGPVILGQD